MSESRHGVGISQNPQQGTAEFVVPFAGGAKGIRTPDLLNAIQTRYQLRHNPKFAV